MTVVRRRAGWGAGSVLRAMTCAIVVAIGLFTGGCGNTTYTYGTAVITLSAVPGPFQGYLVNISALTLTRDDGTVVEPIAIAERANLVQQVDTPEVMSATAVITGTYKTASITIDYSSAQIAAVVNGKSQLATVVDDSGAAVTTVTYTVNFDPAHLLVIQQNVSSRLDLNFDLSASSLINASTSPAKVAVKPFVSVSTTPVDSRPMRWRGLYVVTDINNNNFTMNTRPLFDDLYGPFGAVTVATSAQTVYNVNGQPFVGSAGLNAINGLNSNTIIAVYGTLGNLANVTPTFNATAVYAGTSEESLAADNLIGTVTSRSGNTLTVTDVTGFTRTGSLSYYASLPITVGSGTIVSQDGQPPVSTLSSQSISIGQHILATGQASPANSTTITSLDSTSGQIRLAPTAAWGTLNSATAGSAAITLLTLDNHAPGTLTFTGTGVAAGSDANPASYTVNTGTIDESATALNTPIRFDGFVNAFGSAPPDFTAIAATLGTAADSVLVVNWVGGKGTAPFTSVGASGMVVNLSNANLGSEHYIQTGPVTTDLTTLAVNPTIVASTATTPQLAIGNPTNGLFQFASYSSLLTKINSTLNGTNALERLVAVGQYDAATNTFNAKRIDLLQY